MHTSAVDTPMRMSENGARKAYLCKRLLGPISLPFPSMTGTGGMAMTATMLTSKKIANSTTRPSRILAMNLYLRKYLRSVMSAARCEDDESAQM